MQYQVDAVSLIIQLAIFRVTDVSTGATVLLRRQFTQHV